MKCVICGNYIFMWGNRYHKDGDVIKCGKCKTVYIWEFGRAVRRG
jgi:ribosomal protein S27AE